MLLETTKFHILMYPKVIAKGDVAMKEASKTLHLGAVLGKSEMMLDALGDGADPNDRDDSGATALAQAIANYNPHVFEVLFTNGVSPNSMAIPGEPAIVVACGITRPSLLGIQTLLRWGADINVRGRQGYTPLSIAVESGMEDMAELLLEHGADVNMATSYGLTPLMLAARDGFVDLVKLLLAKGADKRLLDREGTDAKAYAASGNHEEVVRILS